LLQFLAVEEKVLVACNKIAQMTPAQRRLHYAAQPQSTASSSSPIRKKPEQLPIQPPWRKHERLALWLQSLIYVHAYDQMGKRVWFPRIRRLLSWWAMLVWQVPTYNLIKAGGIVDHSVYYARLHVCESCLSLVRRAILLPDGTYFVAYYCASCRCGEKPRAELHKKLWYARHECAEGKHLDGWGQVLKTEIDDDTVDDDVDDDRASNMDADIFRKRSDILKSATNIGNGD